MMRLLRDVRLIPIVVVASVALLSLKMLGLILDGGSVLDSPPADQKVVSQSNSTGNAGDQDDSVGPASGSDDPQAAPSTAKGSGPTNAAFLGKPPKTQLSTQTLPPASKQSSKQPSWAQQMFNFPDGSGDITGSISGHKPPPPPKPGKPAAASTQSGKKTAVAKEPTVQPPHFVATPRISAAERVVLESLQKRRKQLDARARELDMRETLIKAAEKRLEARAAALKKLETKINGVEHQKKESETKRFQSLIDMYDRMDPKDAARIFEHLDMTVLLQVASHIKPRQMSQILANMSPQAAERLTVAFASRSDGKPPPAAANLPKIEGKPSGGS